MVLIEALSVIVRRTDVNARYAGGWTAFGNDVPNPTLCTDGELVRVGFMAPADVEAYVRLLQQRGLRFQRDGKTLDIVVVDQFRGPICPADWLDIRRVKLEEGFVMAGALKHGHAASLATPLGWRFENSLSRSSYYVPTEHLEKGMEFLRHENGLDVYRSKLTGEEVYLGRTGATEPIQSDAKNDAWKQIEAVANRALDLDAQAEQARSSGNAELGARIYGELMEKLLPEAERLADTSVQYGSFANYAVGLVLRVLGLHEPAVERFKRSLGLMPGVENTLLEITLCLGQLGRVKEAEQYATQAVEAAPQSGAAWGNLAMCLIQSGKKAQARKTLDRALVLDPHDQRNRYIAANFEQYFN